jgi:uncharacterized pyridoxal phosphate-containing UPF0001 family protein
VDRLELVQEIQKRAEKAGRILDILVQVNVAEEESKFGLSINEVKSFLKKINKFDAVKVKGLMTIAPFLQNIELVRPVFRELYNIC